MGARRVVTGHVGGRSVVVEDAELTGFSFGSFTSFPVWGTRTSPPPVPYRGSIDLGGPWFPPPGAIRCFQCEIAPDDSVEPGAVDERAIAQAEVHAPGAVAHFEEDGMHATQTVDIGIVQSGRITLELDDGQEVELGAGDFVIQNGTRHGWRNRTVEPCVITFVMIGAVLAGDADTWPDL